MELSIKQLVKHTMNRSRALTCRMQSCYDGANISNIVVYELEFGMLLANGKRKGAHQRPIKPV